MTFPSKVKVTSCTVSNVVSDPPAVNAICVRESASGQTVAIKNFMTRDYDPAKSDPITFTIGKVINPDSTQQIDGFQIEILAQGRYAVDDFTGLTPWLLTTGTMTSANVEPGSFLANKAENKYLFKFTPAH